MVKNLGIVIIASNAYFTLGIRFISRFFHLYRGKMNVKFYFFSNIDPKEYVPDEVKLEHIPVKHLNWLSATNSKFTNILSLQDEREDYLYYVDADTSINAPFVEDWFIGDLVALEHFNNANFSEPKDYPYDRNPRSSCYIPLDSTRNSIYYHASFFGGKKEEMIKLSNILIESQIKNEKIQHIPIWHDESHLNHRFHYNPPEKVINCSDFRFIFSCKAGLNDTRNINYDLSEQKKVIKQNKNRFFDIVNEDVEIYDKIMKIHDKIMKRRLYFGKTQAPHDWETLKVSDIPGIQDQGRVLHLPQFEDNCIDDIYASHVLEYLDYARDVLPLLKEFRRVLKTNGKIYISVLDMDILSQLLLQKNRLDIKQRFHIIKLMFGGHVNSFDFHKTGFTEEILRHYLRRAGFANLHKKDDFGLFQDTSNLECYGEKISLNIIAEKPVLPMTYNANIGGSLAPVPKLNYRKDNQGIIHKILAVEIKSYHALGEKLEWALEIMAYCDEHHFIPQFKFSYPHSSEEDDYFSAFFSINEFPDCNSALSYNTIDFIDNLGLNKNYDKELNIPMASCLISKYLSVNTAIINEVELFVNQHLKEKNTLAVHYRGTDKNSEADTLSFSAVTIIIRHYLDNNADTDCIFVYSDDPHFIDHMENSPLGVPTLYRNNSHRSVDETAVQNTETNLYDINRDAIVNVSA